MRPDNRLAVEVGIKALKCVKEVVSPLAFIGGGWARDFYLDLPIRDVDIWVPAGEIPQDVKYPLESSKFQIFPVRGDRRIDKICKLESQGVCIDIIGLRDPSDNFNPYTVCDRFPFGIQQAFWDGGDF
jgi:hypothetical protein